MLYYSSFNTKETNLRVFTTLFSSLGAKNGTLLLFTTFLYAVFVARKL